MSTGLIVGIVVVVIIVVLIGWGVSAYNNLVTLKNRVKNGWAQIDVQLKQRADLIPNLVNTVKGYASHESEVFTQVTAARAGVVAAASNPSTTTAQRAAAENQLSRALFNLQATAEAYPQLQANQNFMDLQNQLKELENKIATLTGGRAAEEVAFQSVTTGASNDIEQATKLARAMLTRYGMSKEFDMVALETVNNQYLGGDTSLACSAQTQREIDQRVVELVKAQHEKAIRILTDNRTKLDELAKYLYEKETITGDEFMAILEEKASDEK